jgi:hypothetical protein
LNKEKVKLKMKVGIANPDQQVLQIPTNKIPTNKKARATKPCGFLLRAFHTSRKVCNPKTL